MGSDAGAVMREGTRHEVEAAIGARIHEVRTVGGGCISPSFRAGLADGRVVFVKTLPEGGPPGLMEAEALSLRRLSAAGSVRVPHVVACNHGWLALEWLEPAAADDDAWERLGTGLARLHRQQGSAYGWEADNFIGTLPQENGRLDAWPAFWVERRLRPQLRRAQRLLGHAAVARFERLFTRADELLGAAEADGPSLLHGDLWSGNVHMCSAGPAVVDPCCSHGHREVDLAMAALFGGFPHRFLHAYEQEWPLLPGAARRRPVYQLYYLLVHVNLFGGGYVARTEAALNSSLS